MLNVFIRLSVATHLETMLFDLVHVLTKLNTTASRLETGNQAEGLVTSLYLLMFHLLSLDLTITETNFALLSIVNNILSMKIICLKKSSLV